MHLPRWLVPLALTASAFAQQTPPAPPVIRINVNLVQVDAVVTDSRGNPVTDLKIEDFEVLQDGKPQTITNFEFVDIRSAIIRRTILQPPGAPGQRGRGGVAPPPPTRVLRPQQIRRTIALVVDDLGLSFDSVTRVRDSIRKWVEVEMQPGDLVAVIRTSAGMGSLQQFTGDKRVLNAAIDRIRFHVGRVGASSFAPLQALAPAGTPDTAVFDQELAVRYTSGSMGAIQYVVQGLRDVPGRKSLILFSESMRLMFPDGRNSEVEERLRRLSDAANRSSVVIYGVDPRGVVYTGLTAEDNVGGRTPQQIAQISSNRTTQLLFSREGMETLAERTGGLFNANNNDITAMLRQAADDGNGYYLLGYQPEATTFRDGAGQFHSIRVRVKRPGLTVRSRTGFFGTPDRGSPPPRTPIAQITRALSAPFATGDLEVRLTTLFAHAEKQGPYIRAMLFFDARDLTFSTESDGSRVAEVDIAAVTFDADGAQVDGASKTWRFRLTPETYQQVLKTGVVYSINVPVKKAGAYQMRVVLRDSGSQQLGSATQFVEIPDVKKGRLALSGIVLGADRQQAAVVADGAEGPLPGEDPNGTPAVRIFKQGTTLVYGYEILNAKVDRNKKPQLQVQTRLFRDGQEVHIGATTPLTTEMQQDTRRLFGLGRMQLTQLAPGDYALQVVVTDGLAGKNDKIATQSMDFEVR
jgi:VWFA-related protein